MNIIYALYCPDTNKPLYVGLSKGGLNRPFQHIKQKSHSDLVNAWVKSLEDNNKQPIIVILENNVDKKILNKQEKYWIHKLISEGNSLLNKDLMVKKGLNHITPVRIPLTMIDLIDKRLDQLDINISTYVRNLIKNDLGI